MMQAMRVAVDVPALGWRMRYWRRVRGYAPEELAQLARAAQRALGSHGRPITASWIRMMEDGAGGALSTVGFDRLRALCLALDVPPQALTSASVQPPWRWATHGYGLIDLLLQYLVAAWAAWRRRSE